MASVRTTPFICGTHASVTMAIRCGKGCGAVSEDGNPPIWFMQPAFRWRHEWQPQDFLIWDNRSTLHRGRRYDISERREMRRTTINDDEHAHLT